MPLSEGRLPVEDRATQFSDAIYEVICAYDGVPVLMEEHLDRWERSAKGLRIEQRFDRQTRVEAIRELVRRSEGKRLAIYGQLSRGTAPRLHPFPKAAEPNEFWYARSIPMPKHEHYDYGLAAITQPDERWARCWIKTTSLLANCLAKQAAFEKGAIEAILYLEDGTVTEATAANVYAIKDGVIHTHPSNTRILTGIKRGLVLDIARKAGIEVREEAFHLDFLRAADEIFVTSTTLNAMPVTKLDEAIVGNGEVGPVSRLVGERVMEYIEAAVARGLQPADTGAG